MAILTVCVGGGWGLASCTKQDDTAGNPLPDGKYPLTFTATPQTRVSEDADGISSTWTDGDQIGCR